MPIIGLLLMFFVVFLGFSSRNLSHVSAFDPHALAIVVLGCVAAVLIGSSRFSAIRTLVVLRELVPYLRSEERETAAMETERTEFARLWEAGKRSLAMEISSKSPYRTTQIMAELLIRGANDKAVSNSFTELRHVENTRWLPAIQNWELLSKLGPSFGMVGTITGMIQLFQNMTSENMNIGAAMSLALLATLYGVAFGAGIAGPISNHLDTILEERLSYFERCQETINHLASV